MRRRLMRAGASMDTQAAAMRTATAGVSENPGRSAARSPAAAPRNNAGNVGPPRKFPSEMLQATPLNTRSSVSAERERPEASSKSASKACSPENSTAFAGSSVAWLKAIASPPTTSEAAIVSTKGCAETTRAVSRAISTMTNTTAAAAIASTIVHAKSPHPGPPYGGRSRGAQRPGTRALENDAAVNGRTWDRTRDLSRVKRALSR